MTSGTVLPCIKACQVHSPLQWQPRFQLRVIAIALATVLVYHFLLFRRDYSASSHELILAPITDKTQSPCDSLRKLQDVFVILRTGANEAPQKLPVHFNTTLRCLPSHSYGIWSDMEEDIDGYHVMDALDEINPEIVANHPDFQYYRQLQQAGRGAFTTEELTKWAIAPNTASGRDTPGWRLDKWKFLPIAEKAYRRRPDAKWYIFMESDTYINWASLLQWLSKIDASKSHYLGYQMQIGDVVFAYGGSGFAISNPALRKLVEYHSTKPGVYEDFTSNHWAGDCVLGKAMRDAGVGLSWQYPNFFGDTPFDMNYTETWGSPTRRIWCYFATTYHHFSPLEIKEFHAFEQEWYKEHSHLPRHRDVFHSVVLPKLSSKVEDWENISTDDEGPKGTFEECRAACHDKPQCLQFVFHELEKTCKTSSLIKVGHKLPKDRDLGKRVVSGWIMDRVKAFEKRMDAQCLRREANWMLPAK